MRDLEESRFVPEAENRSSLLIGADAGVKRMAILLAAHNQ
jgi:hypothetical protein